MSISSTVVHRADIRFQEAAEALRPHVGCFWVVTAQRDATIRVVPDGTASISVQLQEGRPAEWMLRGPLLRPEERRFPRPAMLIGVRLRPGVAWLLSGIPGQATVDRRISLTGIAAFQEVATCEPPRDSPDRWIDALQRFLIDRLENACVHGVVASALREIERRHGCLRVEDLAGHCRVSARHLNRLMRTWIGYGPKQYANVVRFQATLGQMDRTRGQSPATLASETGYFDQSHLTVDVGRFAGATPGHLTARCVSDFSKTRCDDLS